MSRQYNGHTLVELEEVCEILELKKANGLDGFYGDEAEGVRIVLDLIEHIRELGGV